MRLSFNLASGFVFCAMPPKNNKIINNTNKFYVNWLCGKWVVTKKERLVHESSMRMSNNTNSGYNKCPSKSARIVNILRTLLLRYPISLFNESKGTIDQFWHLFRSLSLIYIDYTQIPGRGTYRQQWEEQGGVERATTTPHLNSHKLHTLLGKPS